jgi:hypothetical protein
MGGFQASGPRLCATAHTDRFGTYRIVRDARGALVHVRTESGECIGCIEVGLFEVIRMVIEHEQRRRCTKEGISRNAAGTGRCEAGRGLHPGASTESLTMLRPKGQG